MRSVCVGAIIWPLVLVGAGAAPAVGAAIPLTADEQAMLDELLGEGVVGEPVAGSALTPAYAPLRDGTWAYRIVGGKDEGQIEQHVVQRVEGHPSGASWRYTVGAKAVLLIGEMGDGSLTFVTEQQSDPGVITRYEPAEPALLTGLVPGDTRSTTIAVEVADLGSPDVVSHKGTLDVSYSYLGAYRVTTPAGAYDAALIKWAYLGKVGPAKVDDTQYRFFAEQIGMIASVDKLEVSALFIYQSHSKFGKLLIEAPQ